MNHTQDFIEVFAIPVRIDCMDKEELLGRIRETRGEIQSICLSVSEEKLESHPGPQSEWTAKDVLAHLTFWEHRTLDRLRGKLAGDSWGDVNSINADLLRRSREASVPKVVFEFLESEKRLVAEIQSLTEKELQQESPWKDRKAAVGASCGRHLRSLRRTPRTTSKMGSIATSLMCAR